MALVIQVNGVTKNAFTRWRTWQVRKDGAMETARIEFLDHDVTAGAWRVQDGDTLHMTLDGGLLFGGEVVNVKDTRLDGALGGGTVTGVDARGWLFEAEDVTVTVAFPSQALLVTAEALRVAFLAGKGWTNLAATTGGPVLPALTYTRQTVRAILDDLQKRSGYPWRVNGDRQFGFFLPGSLVAPVTFADTGTSVVLRGMSWTKDRRRQATRLFITTGGTGEVAHSETHTGGASQVTYPLNAEPSTAPTQVVEGGVTHAIGGGRWTYNANDASVTATTPPGAGVTVVVAYQVEFPATVRVWDVSAILATGAWNYAVIRDDAIQAAEQTDLAQTKTWGDAELAERLASPKTVTLSTFALGLYPWMRATLSFPARLISGDYLINSVTYSDVGKRDSKPRCDVVLMEGDAIGRDWTRWFRERSANTAGGGSVVVGTSSGGGGGGGLTTLPAGITFRVAGDNVNPYTVGTTFIDAPWAVPTQLGGAGMAGGWLLRVPVYQLTAGTVEFRLWDQTAGAALSSTISSTKVAARLSADWDFLSVAFTAPGAVHDVLLQVRVTSGTRQVVVGQATVVKT